ncbi:MAG: polysaccharide biosynthesis tyrosine autokinase [Armatimonadia bacterium]|nr:polysaccharide biosynthesis tyrosine autokinase [Armatimonadia bacterium]
MASVAAEETKPRHLELPDYIRILSKRKWFILVVTAVAILVGGLYALSSERMYESTALVMIKQRPEGFFWVTGDQAGMAPNVAMETYARIVKSSDVTNVAAERLSQLPSETKIIATSSEIQSTLEVGVIPPDLLRIDATSRDERKARYFANYVAQAFVQVNTEDRQAESKTAREFLETQVEKYGQELQNIIEEMTAVAREAGSVDIDTETQRAVENLNAYENMRRELESELRAAEARMAELLALRSNQDPVLVSDSVPQPNPEWSAMQQALIQARLDLEHLQSQYTDDNPRVLDQRALVTELEDKLAETPAVIESSAVQTNPLAEGLASEIKTAALQIQEAQARLAVTTNALESLRQQIQTLPEARQRWRSLSDRLEAAREAYLSLQRELRQARLAEAIKQGNASVVDRAEGAREIQASLFRSLVFAGALGLFVGLALAILLEALDDTIYSVEDLQRVSDLYLLGVIPLRSDEAGPLVTIDAPKSPPAEAYRTLRSNIRFSLFDRPAETFLVTSAGSGEGKSVTAANLAVAYAQSGISVILVDTDLRRPVMHRLFEVDSEVGVTNVVVGDLDVSEALSDTEVPGLKLLSTGPLPPNPAELLESNQMAEMIERLTELADIVIFDSPPAVMLTDATVLASKLDRTIVVAESGQITERALADVERLFRHARADILGIVLNKLRVTGGDYYYYYYYYYYDYAAKPNGEGKEETVTVDSGDLTARPISERDPEQQPQDLSDLNAPADRSDDDSDF